MSFTIFPVATIKCEAEDFFLATVEASEGPWRRSGTVNLSTDHTGTEMEPNEARALAAALIQAANAVDAYRVAFPEQCETI